MRQEAGGPVVVRRGYVCMVNANGYKGFFFFEVMKMFWKLVVMVHNILKCL